MTIEEYSTLMGYGKTCEFEEYKTANFIYMMSGEMDKQAFCKEYKAVGSSPLVLALAEVARSRDMACRDKEIKERQTAYALLREADAVRAEASDDEADAIDKIAAALIGRKECIRWKLTKGFTLSETDREYITANLR